MRQLCRVRKADTSCPRPLLSIGPRCEPEQRYLFEHVFLLLLFHTFDPTQSSPTPTPLIDGSIGYRSVGNVHSCRSGRSRTALHQPAPGQHAAPHRRGCHRARQSGSTRVARISPHQFWQLDQYEQFSRSHRHPRRSRRCLPGSPGCRRHSCTNPQARTSP